MPIGHVRGSEMLLNCRCCAERGQVQRLYAVLDQPAGGVDLRCAKHGRVVLITEGVLREFLTRQQRCEVCGSTDGHGCGHVSH